MLPPKHCNINLTGPIPRWDEAIPLGNGILGSLFWGPMEHLRISVDIAGLWLRRRPEEKLDKEFTYAKLVELARKGDVAETRRIFDTPYARPTPTKIPAGHLFLDGLPRGSYQASLDLGTAVASFSQKGTTMLRAFLCMGRPVGVLMLPEAYLGRVDVDEETKKVNATMTDYLNSGLFKFFMEIIYRTIHLFWFCCSDA